MSSCLSLDIDVQCTLNVCFYSSVHIYSIDAATNNNIQHFFWHISPTSYSYTRQSQDVLRQDIDPVLVNSGNVVE